MTIACNGAGNFFAAAARTGGQHSSAGEVGSSVDDHTELHAAFVRHGAARDSRNCMPQNDSAVLEGDPQPDGVAQVRRTDHVAELARRKAALEAEIAEARNRRSGHGS